MYVVNAATEKDWRDEKQQAKIFCQLNLRLVKLPETDLLLRINFCVPICAIMNRYCSI